MNVCVTFVNLSGYSEVEITKPHGKDLVSSSRDVGNRNPPSQSSLWNIRHTEKCEHHCKHIFIHFKESSKISRYSATPRKNTESSLSIL